MRIWDLPAKNLCRAHLLGEHRELHAIWSILTKGKKGYFHHPETIRWKGRLKALYSRHEELVKEMKNRGYNHQSDLDKKYAVGKSNQNIFVDSPKNQIIILKQKGCKCNLN